MPDPAIVSSLLEGAIGRAARSQVRRFRRLNLADRRAFSKQIRAGSESLDELRSLRMPDYRDPTVALLYMLRYHFAHANLAWSLIGSNPRGLPSPRRMTDLQVVDFGAGTFAMLFGVALFVADELERGRKFGSVSVQSIEPSLAMREMGHAVWSEFVQTVRTYREPRGVDLDDLRAALVLIEHRSVAELDLPPLSASERWLSALHVVYPNQVHYREVKAVLSRLYSTFRPTSGFVTCHRDNAEIARLVAPFSTRASSHAPEPRMPNTKLERLDALCRDIGFVRYQESPNNRQVYGTWSNPLVDTYVLYWG